MIGRTISHYKVTAKLGEGGMGVVYKAEDTKLDRPVALKFLAPHLLRDDEARKRFEREAKAAARLDHPNICTVYEIDEAEGRTFIVMAFLEGRPLSERIKEGPLKLSEALSVAIQTADGLEAAHEKGITHRDIKPDNLMLMTGSRGLVKIMDFGLAQLAGGSKFTREGTTLGTMTYMSPEQAAGAETDSRTDIWSLGVVLYEMVTGQPPFRGDYDQVIVYSLMNEDPEPLTAVRTGVPMELERIVDKCLAKEASDRYQRVDELLVDLRGLQREQQTEAATRAKLPAGAPPAPRKSRWAVPAVVAAALVAAAGAWVGVFERAEKAPAEAMQVVPLTSYAGIETQATLSPEGARAAFAWNGSKQDNFDIYVKNIDADVQERLTSNPAFDLWPVWSPDGRYIAFLRAYNSIGAFNSGGKLEVILIPAIGGPERKLGEIGAFPVPTPVWGPFHTWLPDSDGLVVVDRDSPDEPFALFLLRTETGERRRLTSPPAAISGDSGPAFSPDGTSLAFIRTASYAVTDLYLVDLADDLTPRGEPRRRTFKNESIHKPDWTPDGRSIVFVFRGALWRVSAKGTDPPEALAAAGQDADLPTVSRRGNRLVYVRMVSDPNFQLMRRPDAASKPGPPSRFLSSTRYEAFPQYSPDGSRIAFESRRAGVLGVWAADADGSNAKLLHSEEGTWSGVPSWSPDNRRVAFNWNPEGHFDIYVVGAGGGELLRLTTDPADDSWPSWSHDGRWIYFASGRSGEQQIWKVSAAGGKPVRITRNGGRVAYESVDGRHVYFDKVEQGGSSSLWKVPVNGGEETRVFELVFLVGNFAVVERGVYFIPELRADDPDARYSLQFFNFATNDIETVAVLETIPGKIMVGLTVSPDERNIVYTQVDEESGDLMLIEGFR